MEAGRDMEEPCKLLRYYTLRSTGLSENEAALRLEKMKASSVHELVFQHGVNLAETPACRDAVYWFSGKRMIKRDTIP